MVLKKKSLKNGALGPVVRIEQKHGLYDEEKENDRSHFFFTNYLLPVFYLKVYHGVITNLLIQIIVLGSFCADSYEISHGLLGTV